MSTSDETQSRYYVPDPDEVDHNWIIAFGSCLPKDKTISLFIRWVVKAMRRSKLCLAVSSFKPKASLATQAQFSRMIK